jgi:NAD(P)-dependent dehydrogenase (short-subunit alcohol dehydrogenase family)
MDRLLRNRGVLITGAGRGLGRAYALACAAQGAGVVVNDVDAAAAAGVVAEICERGGRAIADDGSVTDSEQAGAAVRKCAEAFGACDGLVNNAALFYASAPWEEEPQRLRAIVEVNVLGPLYCGTHAMRLMRTQGHGAIVNIVSGAQLGIAGMSAYGATKGAITALTANWALEGAAEGIHVNAVSPLAQTRNTPDDGRGRRPDPAAVAPLIVALLSGVAATTGLILRFDGQRLSAYEPMSLSERCEERAHWTAPELARASSRLTGKVLVA